MRIEIVSTGDEVITGNIDDTNATFLSLELAECGLEVNRRHTAGDNLAELESVFSEISQREAIVLVTGGLGPTNDDLTALAIAHVANVPLCLHQEWVERMEEIFKQRGRVMAESNIKQAMLPQGSLLINNPVGTACGFALKVHNAIFIFAPGVPSELKAMWRASIKEMVIAAMNDSHVVHLTTCRYIMMGIGESSLADLLKPLTLPDGITFGDRAAHPFIELKLIGRDVEPEIMQKSYALIHNLLERYVICLGQYDLISSLKQKQIQLPKINVIDTVCHGLLSLELQKLNISLISSMIINTQLQSKEDTTNPNGTIRPVAVKLPEQNYISLQPIYTEHMLDINMPLTSSGYKYELKFKIDCSEQEQLRQLQATLRFYFKDASEDHILTPRHRTFVTLLCISEIYKILMREPLILPDECSVEVLEYYDTQLKDSALKIGVQQPSDLKEKIEKCRTELAKLTPKPTPAM